MAKEDKDAQLTSNKGSHNIKDVEGAVKTPKLTVTDPNLTSEGIRQCQIFQTKFPNVRLY